MVHVKFFSSTSNHDQISYYPWLRSQADAYGYKLNILHGFWNKYIYDASKI